MRKLADDVVKKVESDHFDASSHLAYVPFVLSRGVITYMCHSGSFFTSNALEREKVNKYKQLACAGALPFRVNLPLYSYPYGSLEYREQLRLAVMKSGRNTLMGLRGRLNFSSQPRL